VKPEFEKIDVAMKFTRTMEIDSHSEIIRVRVHADNQLLRSGVEAMLKPYKDIVILDAADLDAPVDVVVFVAGAASQVALMNDLPSSLVLVLPPGGKISALIAGVRGGACGAVSMDANDRELRTAVTAARQGAFYICPMLAAELRDTLETQQPGTDGAGPADQPPSLTERQISTLRLVALGLTHQQVARRLSLTTSTVDTYVKHIRSKLGVGNKADLTRKAIEYGLLDEHSRDCSGLS
jgi:DNA-binding NarL/FixJ family response regulator